MRRFLFVIFGIISVLNIWGQKQSNVLIAEGKQWSILSRSTVLPEIHSTTTIALLKGDTIINGLLYKKVYEAGNEDLSDLKRISYFVRQVGDKVYYYEKGEENLWFDFGYKKGDEFLLPGRMDEMKVKVTAVSDTILNDGIQRKCLHVVASMMFDDDKSIGGIEDILIEGIGSLTYGIGGLTYGVTGASTVLLCCHDKNNLIYQNIDYQKCYQKSDDEYHPFIMDGTCEWFTALYGFQTTTIGKEDTIIQNKTYKKIYLQRCDSKEKEYRGAIREENKQIFVVFETDKEGKENLLYDFNMKVGDRISYEYLGGLTFEVARIDKVEIEGIARRRYYFYDKNGMYPDQIYPYDSWIEGIGSEQDLMKPFVPLSTSQGGNSRVLCVHRDKEILYKEDRDMPCSCEESPQSLEKTPMNATFRLLKNPVENKLLTIELMDADFSKIDIYSFDGRLLISKEVAAGNGTLEIPIQELQAGNYILILSREDNSRESAKIVVL